MTKLNQTKLKNQRGMVHLDVLLVGIVFLAVTGFVVYHVWQSRHPKSSQVESLQQDSTNINNQLKSASSLESQSAAQPDTAKAPPPQK